MELLEVLTEKMSCEYLSDLRYLKRQNNICLLYTSDAADE